MSTFAVAGDRCGVAGFAARHDLEHKVVCLLHWHPESQRWRARVEDTNEEISVRSTNIETLEQAEAGMCAAATRLQQQQQWEQQQRQQWEQQQQQRRRQEERMRQAEEAERQVRDREVARVMDDILVQLEVERRNDLDTRALLKRAANRLTQLPADLLCKVLMMLPPGPDHLGSAKLVCQDWTAACRSVALSAEWQVSCARVSLLPRSMLTERVLRQWLHEYPDEAMKSMSLRQLKVISAARPHHPLLDAADESDDELDDEPDDESDSNYNMAADDPVPAGPGAALNPMLRSRKVRFMVESPQTLYHNVYGLRHDQHMQASANAVVEEVCRSRNEGLYDEGWLDRVELVCCRPPLMFGRRKQDAKAYEHIKVFAFGLWIGSVPSDVIRRVQTGEARLVGVYPGCPLVSTTRFEILAIARPPDPAGKWWWKLPPRWKAD